MFVASLGPALGIDDIVISRVASFVMIAFGITLLVPALSQKFAFVANSASSSLSTKTAGYDGQGLAGQFVTGALLGAVWTP